MSFSKCFKASIFACSAAFTTAARIDDRNSGLREDDQNHAVAFVQSANLYTKEPLFVAAELGQLDVLRKLIKQNPGIINMKDEYDGKTVAHHAARTGQVEVLQWILDQKAGAQVIRAKDNHGRVPAHVAAAMGQLAVLKFLYKNKMNVFSVKDDSRHTPIDLAGQKWPVQTALAKKQKRAHQWLIEAHKKFYLKLLEARPSGAWPVSKTEPSGLRHFKMF